MRRPRRFVIISGAPVIFALFFAVVACRDGELASTPTATSTSDGPCPAPAVSVEKAALGFRAWFPPGWGAAPGDPRSLDQESGFIIYQLASDADEGLRVRVDFAPPDSSFEGCTPDGLSPVESLPAFCEDIYDILPNGEGAFSSSGVLTAWKFLAPVGPRVINGQRRDSGHIYVKAVFPSARRDELVPVLIGVLSSVEVDP